MTHSSQWIASVLLSLRICLVAMATRPLQDALRYDVMEEQPVGTVVGSVYNSTRGAPGAPARVQYSISGGSNQFVNIDPLSGLVRTSVVLDREAICSTEYDTDCYLEPLTIFVSGRNNYHQVYKLIIQVYDVNDNEPVFPSGMTSLNISETSPAGTRLTVPTAQDVDSDFYGVTEYQLQPLSARQLFRIDLTVYPDGSQQVSLVLLQKLDREMKTSHTITLIAVDGGSPPRSGSTPITINVIDANDNKPRFESDIFHAEIAENVAVGTSVIQLHAVDADDGINAQVIYKFAEDYETMSYVDLIGIEQNTGLIYLKRPLDREVTSSVHMTVMATDRGLKPLSSRVNVVINVGDVNDNKPTIQWTTSSRYGHVVENTMAGGVSIGHVTASDLDLEDNAIVTCRIDDNNEVLFELIQRNYEGMSSAISYQLVTRNSAVFDRELVPRHTLTVICTDHGVPALSSSYVIDVIVDDLNDNNPVFSKSSYAFHLNESSPALTVLGRVEATDPDQGINGSVTFHLEPPSDVISVNMTSGIVTSLVAVDFETQQLMTFEVVASDQGQPARSSRAQLKIVIIDVNDERPIFRSERYFFETLENQPIGTDIGRVEATDRDIDPINRRVIYSIRSRDSSDALQFVELDTNSGQLKVRKTLDYEQTKSLTFEIMASDSQHVAMTTRCDVTINVINLNDNAPEFVFPSSANHSVTLDAEDLYVGQVITRLIGLDKDEGHESHLTFDLDYSDSVSRSFAVNPVSGLIGVVEFEPWRWEREMEMEMEKERQEDTDTGDYSYNIKLSVKVTDNGEPRRSSGGQLNLVIHTRLTMSNLSRPVNSDPASSLDTSSLFIVAGGAALGATCVLVLCLAVLCLTRLYCSRTKPRRVYNCRVNEVHRAPPSGANKQHQPPPAACRSKNKKGVTFDLGADVDDIGQWRDQPRVSSPVLHSLNYCKTDDCALHQFSSLNSLRATNHYGSMPTSGVTDGHVWMTNSLVLPHCGHHQHQQQHQQPDVINSPKRALSLPFSGGFDVVDGDFDVNVKLAQRTLPTDKVLVTNTGRWSTSSLTDSGRGHSEEDDVTTALYVRLVSDPPSPTTKTLLESHV